MEYTNIFRQLLQTEAAARAMQEEAKAFQSGMMAELKKTLGLHRKAAYEKAEEQIAKAEQEAVLQAERQIASLEEDTRRHLDKLRETERQNQSRWIQQIYLAATCQA